MPMNPTERIVRKVETEAVTEENERLAESKALTDELQSAKTALTEAESVPDALLKAAKAGEDVSPGALVEARSGVEIAAAKVEGLTARVAQLSRGAIAPDASAAELIAPLFQRSLIGVPVITTVAPVTRLLPALKGSEGPAVILSQEGATARIGGGLVSSERINVIFVRPSWGADIKVIDLEQEARGMGIQIRVTSNGRSGDYQTFAIRVDGAVEAIPLIPETQDMGVNGAMQSFGAAVMRHLGQYPQIPVIGRGVYSYTGAGCRVDLTSPKVVEDLDAEGVRTTRLDFSCHIHRGDMAREFAWAAPRKIPAQGFQSHVGRLTGIDVVDTTNDPRAATVSQSVTLTYISRVK